MGGGTYSGLGGGVPTFPGLGGGNLLSRWWWWGGGYLLSGLDRGGHTQVWMGGYLPRVPPT